MHKAFGLLYFGTDSCILTLACCKDAEHFVGFNCQVKPDYQSSAGQSIRSKVSFKTGMWALDRKLFKSVVDFRDATHGTQGKLGLKMLICCEFSAKFVTL